ncbi:MAG: hypothetical protein LJE95_09760, partial [Acidobacteria bacterium]|nr:hypothetical protein [Acidobacteriota bacterium]
LTSPDGETWSSTAIPAVAPRAIGWNGHELRIVGGYESLTPVGGGAGTVVLSTDGEGWTTGTVADHELSGVAWGSGQWIAVGAAGTILADPSGQGWVSRSSPVVWDLGGVAAGDGRVVAVGGVWSAHGGSQRSILVSDSGVAFVLRDAKPATPLYDVTWTGSRWIAVGYAGQVATSDDGLTWSQGWVKWQVDDTLFGVAAGDGVVVGAGAGPGNPIVAVSSDGLTWSVHPLGFAGTLLSVAWTGSRFVAVGDSGDVALSDRGGLWTVLPGALPFAARDVVWNGEKLVAVGADGWSAWSVDGSSWTATQTGAPESLSSVAWAEGRLIAVGGDGYAESTDGISWQTGTVAPGSALLGVAADAGAAFAVGRNGAIYRLLLGERASGPAPPGHATVVPVTARTAGLRGTSWESDVTVLSATGGVAEVWLGVRGSGGSAGLWRRFVVPPGGQLVRRDVLAATFGLSHGAEPLWVVSESPLVVSSRTSTAGAGGRYGEGVTPVTVDNEAAEDGRILLVGIDENGARRTDVGITNLTGDAVTAEIDLYRPDGSPIGSRTVDAAPYAVAQINRIVASLTDEQVSAAYVVVSGPPAGSYTAYASVIDSTSGDPVFVPPATFDAGPLVLPAVVHTTGLGGSTWTSVVDVVNAGDEPAAIHFELLPEGGGEVRTSAEIELPPGEARRFQDIMAALFPGGRAGALRVVPDGGEVAVTSRTVDTGGRGAFGQAVPALPESGAFASGEPAFLPGLGSSSEVRTNIGLVNLGDSSTEVRVDLHAAAGELLGTVTKQLPAHSWAQLDRVYQWVTTGQVANGYALITTENPAGRFLTYASVIDNSSADPVTVMGARSRD